MRLPNGYGGVVNLGKRRRRPYAARITVGWTNEGKAIYKYIGYYNTKKEALQALAEYNSKPYDIDGSKLTFSEVYELWKKRDLRNALDGKINCYENAFKNAAAIHDMKIREIKTYEMQSIVDNCISRSKSTLNNIKLLFIQIFKYAMENDIVSKDYSKYVKIKDTNDKKTKTEFSQEEIDILWNNTDRYYVRLILILIYTGFRISELLEMKTENVHIDKKYMQGGKKTKAGKNRIVPIHRRIMPFVEELYNADNIYLINGNEALSYFSFVHYFRKTLTELNIAAHTPHETRHTTASQLNRTGANPVTIKKILGHSNQDLTNDVYVHKTLEELSNTINLIP